MSRKLSPEEVIGLADSYLKFNGDESSEPEPEEIEHEMVSSSPAAEWPELDEAALYGLAGKAVSTIAPFTEADKVTLLVHLLSEFSAIIGRGPHIRLDGDSVPLSFWPVVVGDTSKARKGSGGKRIKRLFQVACPTWTRGKHSGSLSSGEGLIYAVRDEEWGKNTKGDRVLKDEGVQDKRLYLVQPEFGAMLRIMGRDGNSLSGHLREAWDGSTLKPMTKGNRIQATTPHIVVVGHVTKDELLRNLNGTEMANGFGNRFVWFCVKRSKFLPFADNLPASVMVQLIDGLQSAINFTEHVEEVDMTKEAKQWWIEIYNEISTSTPGLAGSMLDRAEAQVRRIAALYALLDSRSIVDTPHLYGALALWKYSTESVKFIFGERIGDPIADAILEAVRQSDEGLTDSKISRLFNNHETADRLSLSKTYLQTQGLIEPIIRPTGGRSSVVWIAKKREKREKR